MDKSHKIISYSILALVFVLYYYLSGTANAVENTVKSVLLVAIASVLTWAVVREQRKRG